MRIVDLSSDVCSSYPARAQVVVEQSRAHQDYTVSGGTRFLRETNYGAVLGGISIPLGRFDRNQGNIARAQAERRQLEFQSEASRLERLRRLASLRADADAARVRAEGIMNDVYPKAVKTLRSEEHTSEHQSLMRISYAVVCLKNKKRQIT